MHRSLRKMLVTALTIGVVILGLVAPASAETQTRTRQTDTDVAVVAARPVRRPAHIDALSLGCAARRDGDGGIGAACRWGSSDEVRTYQLWRIIDRGDRQLVGTYDFETFAARNDVPDDAHVARYAVIGLDGEGEIVARSRVARVLFSQARPVDRPVRHERVVRRHPIARP